VGTDDPVYVTVAYDRKIFTGMKGRSGVSWVSQADAAPSRD
jgi:hypothetical protein